jgi:signal transduction histidine kinase
MFRNIDRAADQMNNMIGNLVDQSRLRAGASALQLGPTDLVAVGQRAAKLAEPGARRQNQRIEINMPTEPCSPAMRSRTLAVSSERS